MLHRLCLVNWKVKGHTPFLINSYNDNHNSSTFGGYFDYYFDCVNLSHSDEEHPVLARDENVSDSTV